MKHLRMFLICLFCMVFLLNGMEDHAIAKYPEKKVRYIVNMAAGGSSDMTARILVQYANPFIGGRLYVENVTGGGGAIGMREAAKASPDGYTIVALVTNSTIGPFTIKEFPPLDQFDPLCLVATDPTA